MRAHFAFASFLLPLLVSGCAQFELYDKDNKEIKGFKYYTAKPYVLVGRTGKTDEPFTITPTYLPDLDNPVYAKAKPGWLGNSHLTMQFNDNGTLHDFGQEGNNNISDLVNQLGGFAKNLADAQVARSKIGAADAPLTPSEGKSYSKLLADAHVSADRNLNSVLRGFKPERDAFNAPNRQLASIAKELDNPATLPDRQVVEERLREVLADWKTQGQALKNGKDREVAEALAHAEDAVRQVIRRLREAGVDAHFTLYEVVIQDGKPALREVTVLPPAKP